METQEFKDKVSQIGVILKMSVEFPSDEDMKWHRWAYLKKDDQSIRISHGDENKLHISGDFPKSIKGETSHYGNPIDINVSCSKSPQRIARDIENRLLPLYLPELEKAVEQVKNTNIYHQKRQSNIQKVADYFGIELTEKPWDNKEPSIYVYGFAKGLGSKIETCGENNIKFELELTPEMAIEVFNFLKQKSL